ncbi:MAG: hypothetical protein AMJ38_01270 [Dehalococcoidia bacterium DG_22]|nr:MAG: hypothetical protein AMJ38_01270 [Dehalococcoidia bacterium DG_22]
MHPERGTASRKASFVLRIWWEEGDAGPIWRGWTQHAASGDSRYFQTMADLLHFLEQHAGDLSEEGGVRWRDKGSLGNLVG